MAKPVYTKTEKATRARLLFKGAKNSYGDTSRIEKQLERIEDSALDRGEREEQAHKRALNAAKDEVAAARVKERTSPRAERQAARKTRQEAEKRLRLVERGAR